MQFLFLIFVMIIYAIVYLQISLVFFQVIPNFIIIQTLIIQIFLCEFPSKSRAGFSIRQTGSKVWNSIPVSV